MSDLPEFVAFDSISRLNRDCVITEKIDGTNAQVYIGEDGLILAGSRTRWITPDDDNYNFAKWVEANKEDLRKMGPGRHAGEWWGSGISRGYGLEKGEKRFSLFNTGRWGPDGKDVENLPDCCSVVPVLYEGLFCSYSVAMAMEHLTTDGSLVSPGFDRPEGVVIFHLHSRTLFKVTFEGDLHKGQK